MAPRSTAGQVTLARNAGGGSWGLAVARHQAAAGHSECALCPCQDMNKSSISTEVRLGTTAVRQQRNFLLSSVFFYFLNCNFG